MIDSPWKALDETIIACRLCPRLVDWREQVARVRRRAYQDQEYWGRPITGFGDRGGRVLVVGLAPGAHGANRTGRVFTGDGSGEFLFSALFRAGFANQPSSKHCDDGLVLRDLYISAVCRCAPPGNKPTPTEIATCLPFLARELDLLPNIQGIVVLGKIAFDGVLRVIRRPHSDALHSYAPHSDALHSDTRSRPYETAVFSHGLVCEPGGGLPWLLCSYHPSRQNTQTGRFTPAMFDRIWEQAKELLAATG
jgi:uracil-DNA glycosylase family 4